MAEVRGMLVINRAFPGQHSKLTFGSTGNNSKNDVAIQLWPRMMKRESCSRAAIGRLNINTGSVPAASTLPVLFYTFSAVLCALPESTNGYYIGSRLLRCAPMAFMADSPCHQHVSHCCQNDDNASLVQRGEAFASASRSSGSVDNAAGA